MTELSVTVAKLPQRVFQRRCYQVDTGVMTNFKMTVSTGRAAKRGKSHRRRLLFVLTLLLAAAHQTPGQQPSESKDLAARSASGKPGGPAEVMPPNLAIDLATVDSAAILRSARVIFVRSHSVLVKGAVVEDKLQKHPQFEQFGLLITRDASAADLILELRHDLFTKYVYTAVESKTQIVVASGKLSSLGGTVADKVAKRFLQQMAQARLPSGSEKKD